MLSSSLNRTILALALAVAVVFGVVYYLAEYWTDYGMDFLLSPVFRVFWHGIFTLIGWHFAKECGFRKWLGALIGFFCSLLGFCLGPIGLLIFSALKPKARIHPTKRWQ